MKTILLLMFLSKLQLNNTIFSEELQPPCTSTEIFQGNFSKHCCVDLSGWRMSFNGGSNGHLKTRKQSQRNNQCSGGFFRPPVGKDPPSSPHDVGERPLLQEPPQPCSPLSSTTLHPGEFFQPMTLTLW